MNEQMNGLNLHAVPQIAELQDQGTVVEILDIHERPMTYTAPDGTRRPVTITVAGAHSRRYRKAEEAIRRRKLNPRKLTGEVFYEDNIEKVAACTLRWEGIFAGDVPVECERRNVAEVYKAAPWVLEQVSEAMHDHERFFSNSSETR